MAVISTKTRNRLPKSSFALKKKVGKAAGSYPIPDISYARNARARVMQFGSSAEQKAVFRATAKKFPRLRKSSGSTPP
jgi:hypothetical protein